MGGVPMVVPTAPGFELFTFLISGVVSDCYI